MRPILKHLPGKGTPVSAAVLATLTSPHPLTAAPADVGFITLVGCVSDPRLSLRAGEPVWQCTLLQTAFGRSCEVERGIVLDTQLVALRVIGQAVEGCKDLRTGALVVALGKLLQRPKFIQATTSYDIRPEILVSDVVGSVTFIR